MKIPTHIGFIMDGNGRWAKSRGKPRTYGHSKGADNIVSVVEDCYNMGVKVVSLYAFSTENWSRPKEEVDKIFELLKKFLKKYYKTLLEKKSRLVVSGDITKLPEGLVGEINRVISLTKDFDEHVLNIAINYGARSEIVRAVNEIIRQGVTNIDENTFSDYLYTKGLPDPDLIVRTSGEQRISNFLLYQSAYAELYFTNVMWPDFNGEELTKAIEYYSGRNRRYGKVE